MTTLRPRVSELDAYVDSAYCVFMIDPKKFDAMFLAVGAEAGREKQRTAIELASVSESNSRLACYGHQD